jgi:hypothetical protein
MPLSLHSMEVINKLTASGCLPPDVLQMALSNLGIDTTGASDASDALNHPWFQKALRGDYDHLTLEDALSSLRTFHAGSRLK